MATDDLPIAAQDAELIRLAGQAATVLSGAQEIEITSKDRLDYGVAYLGEIVKVKKAAEVRRTALVKPLNDAVKSVNDFVKSLLAPVERADSLLRERILGYRREQQRQAEEDRRRQEEGRRKAEEEARRQEDEARRKLEEAARLEGQDKVRAQAALDAALKAEQESIARRAEVEKPVVFPPPAAQTVRTGMGTATAKKRWTFRVVNETIVPRLYFMLDETRVRRAIAEGAREIPGLEIYQEESLSVRA